MKGMYNGSYFWLGPGTPEDASDDEYLGEDILVRCP